MEGDDGIVTNRGRIVIPIQPFLRDPDRWGQMTYDSGIPFFSNATTDVDDTAMDCDGNGETDSYGQALQCPDYSKCEDTTISCKCCGGLSSLPITCCLHYFKCEDQNCVWDRVAEAPIGLTCLGTTDCVAARATVPLLGAWPIRTAGTPGA